MKVDSYGSVIVKVFDVLIFVLMSYFFAFWIGVICASVIVKVLTIFSFIARLLRSYGICFLVYLELVGSCLCLLLGSLVAGKVVLVAIVMEIFGTSFLFV